MNTTDNNENPEPVPTDRRPLGLWLRVVDDLITHKFAATLESEGITRREWMKLNVLAGDVDAPGADRLVRKGKSLRGLQERGWVEQRGDGSWQLTDAGREARDRIAEIVDGIRSRVVAAAGDEAFATTMASLEAIARELGWDETDRPAWHGFRGFGRRGFAGPGPFHPGFGGGRPGFEARSYDASFDDGCRHLDHAHAPGHEDRGFGPERGLGPGHGFGPGRRGHGHPHGGGRRAQEAYERGFDAGFARGRESSAA